MASPAASTNPLNPLNFFKRFAMLPFELRHEVWESNIPNPKARSTKDLVRTLVHHILVDMHYEDSPRKFRPFSKERRRGPGGTSTIFSLRIEGPCPYGAFAACSESRTVALRHLMTLLDQHECMRRSVECPFPRVKIWINEKRGSLMFASWGYEGWKQWNLEELVFWDYETYEKEEQEKNAERRLWEARLALGDCDYYGEEAFLKSDKPGSWGQELDRRTRLPKYQSTPGNMEDYSYIAEVPQRLLAAYSASEAGTVYDEDIEQESNLNFNIIDRKEPVIWDDGNGPDTPYSVATKPEEFVTSTSTFIPKPTLARLASHSSSPSPPPMRPSKRKRADEEEEGDCAAGSWYDNITPRRKRKRISSKRRERCSCCGIVGTLLCSSSQGQ